MTTKPKRLPHGLSLKQYIQKVEIAYIVQALIDSNWNIVSACELLGCQHSGLVYKINKYNIKLETPPIKRPTEVLEISPTVIATLAKKR